MGTPEFAAKSLEQLYRDGYDIAGVFTQADKPKNRGMKLSYSPVKELAVSRGTTVYQPNTLKDKNALEIIKNLHCDLIVVVAYGKLLPQEILDIPPLGCINIHASILPKYRGAAPIQHAILCGETETGVTSMYLSAAMDSGDIISIKKTAIGENETSTDLFEKLSILGAQLLSETVAEISKGSANRVSQNPDEVTYAPLLRKDMSPIDWSKSAHEIKCAVRGLQPWPVATMELGGQTLKVFEVDVTKTSTGETSGSIISYGEHGIEIACADGTVIVKQIQASGSKRMSAADYLRGNPIKRKNDEA